MQIIAELTSERHLQLSKKIFIVFQNEVALNSNIYRKRRTCFVSLDIIIVI